MSKIELKPCPICGEEVILTQEDQYGNTDGDWYVSCEYCSLLFGFWRQFETEKEAAEAWNERV